MTKQQINHYFTYQNGKLFWKTPTSRRVKIGQEAGSVCSNGYRMVRIKGVSYYTHKLIYLLHNDDYTTDYYIDHIDRNRLNNLPSNLRLLTPQQSTFNTSCKGYIKSKHGFMARITLNGKTYVIGTYKTETEATKAYLKVKEVLHVYLGSFPTEDEIKSKILEVRPSTISTNSSGFSGVHKRPNGTYQARITENGKRVSLGHFKTPEEAANAILTYKNSQ